MVFVSFRKKISDNTRVRIILFFVAQMRNFFPDFNIRLYDKNSESDYFFFLHQNQNIFFSNIGNQNSFLEKKHTLLQVKWLFPYDIAKKSLKLMINTQPNLATIVKQSLIYPVGLYGNIFQKSFY